MASPNRGVPRKRPFFSLSALIVGTVWFGRSPRLDAASVADEPATTDWSARAIRLPPFYWDEPDPEIDRRFRMVSLLYWDWRQGTSSQRLLLPVFYRWQEADRRLWVSLPCLASYHRSGEQWFWAGPYYRGKNDQWVRTLGLPLYWQKSRVGGGRVTAFWPFLFYDYRNAARTKIDQVYLLGARRVRGSVDQGMVLNYVWARDAGQEFRTLFPILWHRRTPERTLDVWGPVYRRHDRPSAVANETNAVEQIHTGFFPLVGWGGTPLSGAIRSSYLFPFYHYSRSPSSRGLLTLPASRWVEGDRRSGHALLYFYDHDPAHRLDGFFPLATLSRSDQGSRRSVQLLTFFDRQAGDDRFQTLFPLYGYWRDLRGSRFLTWGLYRSHRERRDTLGHPVGDDESGWALLYYWRAKSEGDRTRVLFPLYWHRKSSKKRLDLVLPLYGHYRDGDFTTTAALPFLHTRQGDRALWSVMYLYWHDRTPDQTRQMLFPFFYGERGTNRQTLLTPLLWTRSSPLSREGAWPLGYWYQSAEKSRRLVLPLYWHDRAPDRSLTIVAPYYRSQKSVGRSEGFFPLWGRFRSEWERGHYLTPLYWVRGDEKGNGTLVVPPLLGYGVQRGRGTPRESRDLRYLLFGHVTTRDKILSHGFFPLYRYDEEGEFNNFWAPRMLPLIAWKNRGALHQGIVFPYAWKRSPAVDWNLLFPLWYGERRYAVDGGSRPVGGVPTERTRVLFPVLWSGQSASRSYRTVIPLYADFQKGPSRLKVVTPLFWSSNATAGGKFRLLFPLYWRVVSTAQGEAPAKDISVYGLWYRVTAERDGWRSRTTGLAPFYSQTAAGNDDRYFEILGGLFARDSRGGRRRFKFLWVFATRPRPLASTPP